jgi:hypothetical protein
MRKVPDFKLQVMLPVEDEEKYGQIVNHWGYRSDEIYGNSLRAVVFEGTWQNIKHLAQTLENRYNLKPVVTYQGKYSSEELI